MIKLLMRLLLNMAAWYAAVHIIGEPAIILKGFRNYVLVVFVMAFVNTFIKPVLKLLALPLNIITLGIFTFAINAFLLQIVAHFSPLEIQSFWVALKTSVVLGIAGMILNSIFK